MVNVVRMVRVVRMIRVWQSSDTVAVILSDCCDTASMSENLSELTYCGAC